VSWLLEIVHETRMHYQGAARASYNEARMTPLTLPSQTALQTRVSVGNGTPVWAYPRAWDELRAGADTGLVAEYLAATPRTTVDTALAEAARERTRGADPLETASAIAGWVRDRVEYMPGATEVQTSAQEAWDKGQGVCQDIAHLTVALLRETGLPARYVSGYLHPRPEAGLGQAIAGQSHAWVEYWAGDWVAADPTNQASVGEGHVVVARGRDYADVPPLKGIYHGAPSVAMDVTVEVTRLA
jgi:transglutaminase-like putative cysteine protease